MVKEFLNRPIEGSIPDLFVDASYFKVRTDGRYINKALIAKMNLVRKVALTV